jgi:hypothetical protein
MKNDLLISVENIMDCTNDIRLQDDITIIEARFSG